MARAASIGLLCVLAGACAESIPRGAYGVSSIEIRGTEQVDAEAIEACLATHPRERFGFGLGHEAEHQCGVPPFERNRRPVRLWAWPWAEWPLWNPGVFERDRDRIERFYRARGYYDARVTEALVLRNEETREVDISIEVDEGEPVLVVRLSIEGLAGLPADVQQAAREAIALFPGAPFDEALYDQSKEALRVSLLEASYAKASVEGRVEVEPERKIARVFFDVSPGPACRFGDLIIVGHDDLSRYKIRRAADVERGSPFSLGELRDAQRGVYALGPFASVEVEHHPRPDSPIVDVLIRVLPARRFRFGIGIGMQSGGPYALDAEEGTSSFAQWDVHLLGKIEHRNFLGGMRRLRIEERPRWIFDSRFPGTERSAPGNLLVVELRQPAFLEPRTSLLAKVRWDRGPDPYGNRFLRHDLLASAGPERYFVDGRLRWSSTVGADLLLPDEPIPFPSTEALFLNHSVRYDLRDDPRNPTRGAYFSLGVQHSGTILPSDWTYLRVTQDSRAYLPLPAGLVLAGRARLGLMEVFDSDIAVPMTPAADGASADSLSARELAAYRQNLARFGPLRQRLRGGGHNSVRGYAPNTLGDAQRIDGRLLSGGLRQWEASLELRVPVTQHLGAVLFTDVGDVSQSKSYRFDHPQTSIGFGLRYRTLVGPLRLDVAFAPRGLQVIGRDERDREGLTHDTILGYQGAIHFTIGEAY